MASVEHAAFGVTPIPVAESMTQRPSKFTAPPPPPSSMARPGLVTRLDDATKARLTVVSGRAGSGKTTLLASWIRSLAEDDCAWITLDTRDNAAETLWSDIDRALHHLGRSTRAGLTGLHTWRDAYLVLDNCDVLTSDEARNGLAELIALAPQWMHLVLASRGQPPLSLWRLRAEGNLLEIGDADLRLDPTEVAEIVAQANPAHTPSDDLHECAEGWITGVKLMTATGRANVGDRNVLREFFLEEVFARQAPDTQQFLMETAWLEYVTPGLCESITQRPDAADVLQQLERADLFINRVPGKYGTYRFHTQFRAMLRDELEARHPDRVVGIHTSAARWYQAHNDADSAVAHWLAAGNVTDAVRLLPDATFTTPGADRDTLTRALLAGIQPSIGAAGVWQLLDYATALNALEQPEPLAEILDHVDTILDAPGASPDDAAAFRSAFLRGLWRVSVGDVEGMVVALERAQAILDANPDLVHDARLDVRPRITRLHVWLGNGYRWLERPRAARRALARTPTATIDRRDLHFRDSTLAAAAYAGGYLSDAAVLSARALEQAAQLGIDDDITVRAARQVEAGLLQEHDELPAAKRALEALTQPRVGPATGVFAITAQVQLADVLRSECDVSGALEILLRLRQHTRNSPGSATDRTITRSTVLCLLEIGRVDAARITLGSASYPAALSATAALVALAEGEPEQAGEHLSALYVNTPRRLLCVALLRARIAEARGDTADLERQLRRSLRVARREGFVRTVVMLAPDLVDHLNGICTSAADADFVARLRRANGRTLGLVDPDRLVDGEPQLSARELEVLSYLPTQLSAREIADALHVSMNTLKTHMQNVYRKLRSDSRESAVGNARKLQLLR